MKLIQKQYKADKIVEIFKAPQFFIAQQGNINSQKIIELNQKLAKENIKLYKLKNNLVNKLYAKSNFLSLNRFMQGSLVIGYSRQTYHSGKVIQLMENFTILCLKENSKLYTPKEIKSVFLNSNHANTHRNLVLEIAKVLALFYCCLNKASTQT